MAFSKNFLWGAATASHQIEGAYLADGKSLNIWDALCEGNVLNGDDGKVACDHYNRYREDVAIMKSLGLKSYRFSVSWARIFPDASGKVNEKGIEFYKSLVDELIAADIVPMCTLYHWDLPMWLYEIGGWENPEIGSYFEKYAVTMVEALSDKIEYWLTFNEPQCIVACGYKYGDHAPFLRVDESRLEKITCNIMLSHGRAVPAMRKAAKRPIKIGAAPTCGITLPLNDSEAEIERAREASFAFDDSWYSDSWWSDPVILGKRAPGYSYPTDEQLKQICQPLDFYAFNIYNAAGYGVPGKSKNGFAYTGFPRTTMEWGITPDCMYWASKFLFERYGLPLLITENGMANIDFKMLDGEVHDPQRSDFIHRYLKELRRAVDEGVPVIGYQYWSLLDNFEWAIGYTRRFGLVYVDYRTCERTVKDSARFYAEVIRTNGECL